MLDEMLEAIDNHKATYGLTMTEIVDLPHPLSSMLRGLVRRRTINQEEACNALGLNWQQTSMVLDRMLAKEMIAPVEDEHISEVRYRIVLVHTRYRAMNPSSS
jgi:hypothetical protein